MTKNKDPTYDCTGCRYIYDERTGLCSVCIRKILDEQHPRRTLPQATKAADESCASCTSSED